MATRRVRLIRLLCRSKPINRISACVVQETHITETNLENITTLDNKHNYDFISCCKKPTPHH